MVSGILRHLRDLSYQPRHALALCHAIECAFISCAVYSCRFNATYPDANRHASDSDRGESELRGWRRDKPY